MSYLDFLENDLLTEAFDKPLVLSRSSEMEKQVKPFLRSETEDFTLHTAESGGRKLAFIQLKRQGRHEIHIMNIDHPMYDGVLDSNENTAFKTPSIYATASHLLKTHIDQGHPLRISAPESLIGKYKKVAIYLNNKHYRGEKKIKDAPDFISPSNAENKYYPTFHID